MSLHEGVHQYRNWKLCVDSLSVFALPQAVPEVWHKDIFVNLLSGCRLCTVSPYLESSICTPCVCLCVCLYVSKVGRNNICSLLLCLFPLLHPHPPPPCHPPPPHPSSPKQTSKRAAVERFCFSHGRSIRTTRPVRTDRFAVEFIISVMVLLCWNLL